MQILALDISASSTGAAIGDGNSPPRTLRASFPQRPRGKALSEYRAWLRQIMIMEKPALVVAEAALVKVDRESATETTMMLLALAFVTEELCGARSTTYKTVAAQTWRKAFLGHGYPADAKAASMLMCDRLGWEHGGNHDRAESAGVLAYAHLFHGNQRGMHRLLSASSVRAMEGR